MKLNELQGSNRRGDNLEWQLNNIGVLCGLGYKKFGEDNMFVITQGQKKQIINKNNSKLQPNQA